MILTIQHVKENLLNQRINLFIKNSLSLLTDSLINWVIIVELK